MNGIWKYCHLLPAIQEPFRTTLGEGNTPLLHSKRLGPSLGLNNLYFKLEMLNPSGSYKDRFAASAISQLREQKLSFCLATSSGNTGAALAAYCSAADIRCFLAIVDGAPSGKIQQMQIYGASTLMVKDFGKRAEVSHEVFSCLQQMASRYNSVVQISAYQYSPMGMAGVQTIAYEIAETLPTRHVFCPAGGGGLTLAVARGFQVWARHHRGCEMPKVHCVQPSGNDTIATALRAGRPSAIPVAESTTSISGLQVPNVIDGDEVIASCRQSGGTGYTVDDELIYRCQKEMALQEGIFCEPAGAVALGGAVRALERREVHPDDAIVCLVTGHGFKDPVAAEQINNKERGRYFDSPRDTMKFIENELHSDSSQNQSYEAVKP